MHPDAERLQSLNLIAHEIQLQWQSLQAHIPCPLILLSSSSHFFPVLLSWLALHRAFFRSALLSSSLQSLHCLWIVCCQTRLEYDVAAAAALPRTCIIAGTPHS